MLASGSAKLFEAGLLHLESELKQIADSTDWERGERTLVVLLELCIVFLFPSWAD